MSTQPLVLDSDTLSELSRGNARVVARAAAYLARHGQLTIIAVSVFERLRGYQAAVKAGKPFEIHLESFRAFVATCRVLPLDSLVAERAVVLWAALSARHRRALGDLLIAATASAHGLPLVTRDRRHFGPMARVPGVDLSLVDWTR